MGTRGVTFIETDQQGKPFCFPYQSCWSGGLPRRTPLGQVKHDISLKDFVLHVLFKHPNQM